MWKIKSWSFGSGNYFDAQICIMPTLCMLWEVSLFDDFCWWLSFISLTCQWEFDPIMPLDYFLEWSAWFCKLLYYLFSFLFLSFIAQGLAMCQLGGVITTQKVLFCAFNSLCYKHFCVVVLHFYSNWHVKDPCNQF